MTISEKTVNEKNTAFLAELKVKIVSLMLEAGVIRREEHKAKKRGDRDTFHSLQTHRRYDVRREARAALLAYAYLRGKPYAGMEHKNSSVPVGAIVRAADIVLKFSGPNGPKNRQDAKNVMVHWIDGNKPMTTRLDHILHAVGLR